MSRGKKVFIAFVTVVILTVMLFLIYLFNKKIEELPSLSDRPNVDNVIRDPENEDVGGWGDDWDTNYDPNETPEKPTQSSVLAGLLYRTNNKLLSNPTYLNESTYNYDREETKTDYLNFSSAPQELTPKLGWFKVENIDGVRKITEFQFYYEDRQVSRNWLNKSFEYVPDEDENSSKTYDVNREVVLETKEIKYNGINKIVNVADYGAIPDDNIDDTASIKKAVDEINKEYEINFSHVSILYFPTGHYNVSVTQDAFWYQQKHFDEGTVIAIKNKTNPIILEFANSKLSLAGNAVCNNYMLCILQNTNKVIIQNGTLQGDRMTHNYINYEEEEGMAPTSWQSSVSHAHGFGIYVRACSDALIKNMEVYDFIGDSIYIINSDNGIINKTNTSIENCFIHHSRRQGVTVSDSEFVSINNTEISHIGTHDWAYKGDYEYAVLQGIEVDSSKVVIGTAPMAGIDIEPAFNTKICKRFEMRNSYIHSTTTYSIVTGVGSDKTWNTEYFLVENSILARTLSYKFESVEDSSIQTNDWRNGYGRRALMRNCIISLERNSASSFYHLSLDGIEMQDCKIIKNNKGDFSALLKRSNFDNCEFLIPEKVLVKVVNEANGYLEIANSVFRNCHFENWLGKYKGNDATWTHEGIAFVRRNDDIRLTVDERSSNNTFKNCAVIFRQWAIMTNFKFIGDNLLTDTLPDGDLYSYFYAYPFRASEGYGAHNPEDPNICSVFNKCSFIKTTTICTGTSHIMKVIDCFFDEYCGPGTGNFFNNNTYIME